MRKADPPEAVDTLIHYIWSPIDCSGRSRLQIRVSCMGRERIYLRVESDEVMAAKNDYRQPSRAKVANNNLIENSGPESHIRFAEASKSTHTEPRDVRIRLEGISPKRFIAEQERAGTIRPGRTLVLGSHFESGSFRIITRSGAY